MYYVSDNLLFNDLLNYSKTKIELDFKKKILRKHG